MKLSSFYPVIGTDKIEASKEFYTTHFSFELTFEADWYVSMRLKDNPEFQLALLDYRHPSVPEGFRYASQGTILNFEVDDVDAEYQRLKAAGFPMALDIRSEDWGQRHFITTDPNGLLLDIITIIPPSEDFAKQYSDETSQQLFEGNT